jgi:hypothetical protein
MLGWLLQAKNAGANEKRDCIQTTEVGRRS